MTSPDTHRPSDDDFAMPSAGEFSELFADVVDPFTRLRGHPRDQVFFLLVGCLAGGFVVSLSLILSFLLVQYNRLRRQARYRERRRLVEAKERFLAGLAEVGSATDAAARARCRALVEEFAAARRDVEREAAARWDAERLERSSAPWLGPRATARRRDYLRRRTGAWLDWSRAAREAAARGEPVPPEPGARRRTGAPIRRLCRASINPMPEPRAVVDAYRAARGRGRVAEKIRCGSLLLDAEAGVDSSLVRTETGEIVGRNPGLRGWIADNAPQLLKHYVSLMQFRRLAQAFREAHGLRDPHPASLLLDDRAAAVFPQPLRRRIEAARREAKAQLEADGARTVQDFRRALARREWRRTG